MHGLQAGGQGQRQAQGRPPQAWEQVTIQWCSAGRDRHTEGQHELPKGLMQSFGIWRHPGFDFYKPCADFDIRVYTFLRVDFIGGIFYDLMLVAWHLRALHPPRYRQPPEQHRGLLQTD